MRLQGRRRASEPLKYVYGVHTNCSSPGRDTSSEASSRERIETERTCTSYCLGYSNYGSMGVQELLKNDNVIRKSLQTLGLMMEKGQGIRYECT